MAAMRKVKIKWLDAYSIDGWHGLEELDKGDQVCTTEGPIVMQNKNYIFVAGTVSGDGDEFECCTTMAIPRATIVSPARYRVRK